MGCKGCQEKQLNEVAQKPCEDQTQNDFRLAYVNENKKATIAMAEAAEWKIRFEKLAESSTKALRDFDSLVKNREKYIATVFLFLQRRYPDAHVEAVKQCGHPPVSMQVGAS